MANSDPSRTLLLRRQFEGDFNKRFRMLRGMIRKLVDKEDAFGLRSPRGLASREFAFRSRLEQVTGFMNWLNRVAIPGTIDAKLGKAIISDRWTDANIQSAYLRGITRADAEIRKAGGIIDGLGTPENALSREFYLGDLEIIQAQTWDNLKGIDTALSNTIRRVLADGLAGGVGPRELAEILNIEATKINIKRARTIARTEVIRAHHQASIQRYEQAGAIGVRVVAEWKTAGDLKVCPDCQALEDSREMFTLAEIKPMIPLHPNCRCVALPVIV